jgi:N-methylhydantoinase B
MGDLRAQVTAIKTGERRFLELLERYGQKPVLDCIEVLMDHSEAVARERTRSIPDGVYEAESFMDDDAVDVAKRIPIRVKVVVSGDEMTVDLTEVAKQVRGFYNSGPTTGIACAQVAFKCITSPTDYPVNDGSFRNLKVILPPGSIVSAVRPAPMRWWMTFPMTVVDTIFKALSKAVPDQVIAGHHADLCVAMLDGFYPDTGKLFITSFGPLGGGWGAKRGEDGVSATVCINDGDTHNSPNEQFEAKFPVMVESLSLISDSGGPGLYRGGLGVETVVQALFDFNINTSIERAVCLP